MRGCPERPGRRPLPDVLERLDRAPNGGEETGEDDAASQIATNSSRLSATAPGRTGRSDRATMTRDQAMLAAPTVPPRIASSRPVVTSQGRSVETGRRTTSCAAVRKARPDGAPPRTIRRPARPPTSSPSSQATAMTASSGAAPSATRMTSGVSTSAGRVSSDVRDRRRPGQRRSRLRPRTGTRRRAAPRAIGRPAHGPALLTTSWLPASCVPRRQCRRVTHVAATRLPPRRRRPPPPG